jgi:putative ABC transport system permease protein
MFAMYLVVLSMGLIAGQIIGDTMIGIIGVSITIALLGLLALLMWLIVWLVGKLPSFGWIDLRLALRNLSTRRMRTATTLLALSAGMFSLSGITFFATGVSEIIRFTFTDTLGGNILILPVLPASVSQPLIDAQINTLDGIEYRTQIRNYDGQIVAVDGQPFNIGFSRYLNATARVSGAPNPPPMRVLEGRGLTAEDAGRPVAVLAPGERFEGYPFRVGSFITVEMFGPGGVEGVVELELVGIAPPPGINNIQGSFGGDLVVAPGVLDGYTPDFQLNLVRATPEALNSVLLGLSALPLTFSFDISFVDSVFRLLIDQFSAVPALVGLLSLGAAAVIMANTVALATLERRRQIGILKAVGLKGGRVLRIMLLENTLIALLGGLLGLGLSAIGGVVMTAFGLGEAQLIPRDALPTAFALLALAVGIGALATVLSASVAVRERVLNVLRYE